MTAADNQVTLEEALELAQRHHQTGNLIVAEQTYRDILNAVPDYFPAITYLGIVLYQKGDVKDALTYFKQATEIDDKDGQAWGNYAVVLSETKQQDEAVKAFKKAIKLAPDNAEIHSNYAHTCWQIKDFDEAEKHARRAIALNPDFPDALLNLGNAVSGHGNHKEAIQHWKKAVKINDQYFKAHNNLGFSLRVEGKSIEAEEYCRKAIELNPQYPEAWNNLGNVLYDQGKVLESEEAFRQATNFKPDYEQAHNNLALALLAQSRYAEAAAAARYATTFNPEYADAYSTLSIAEREQGNMMEAEKNARKAIDLAPDNAELHLNLVDILLTTDRLDDANQVVEKALELNPDTPSAYSKLASIKELMGDLDAALHYIEDGLEKNPDYVELLIRRAQIYHINNDLPKAELAIEAAEKIAPDHVNVMTTKSDILQSLGKMDEAEKFTRAAQQRYPNFAGFYFSLSKFKKFTKDDPDFKKMKELAKNQDRIGIHQASALNYGLFSAYQNVGQYSKAFNSLKQANDLRRKIVPYNSRIAQYQYENLKETNKKGFAKPYIGKGYKSEIPVFIVGMPRSGTTLTEQIISSHPDVYGAGELPHFSRMMKEYGEMTPENAKKIGKGYVDAVKELDTTGKALRITDKMPGNFSRMADIVRALPEAKIIHCRRDPIDTCLSCYKQNFARGQYWSYNLEELAAEYRRYADLMAHWRKVLPEGSFIEINYEETVADLEKQARMLIDYVGLPWDDACLSPHKNKRAVLTASKAQVIRPVYSSSVKAWKRYEKQLQPLIEGLGDLVPQKKKKAPAKKAATSAKTATPKKTAAKKPVAKKTTPKKTAATKTKTKKKS